MATANPLLSYFVRATPLVIKEAFKSYVKSNAVMESLYNKRKMKALSGTNVQVPFVNSRHSQLSEISASTNWQVNKIGRAHV